MRARRKLVSSYRPGGKGTCPLSHNDRLSLRRVASRRPGSPAASLQFPWPLWRLIANPRLEFGVSINRINQLEISHRERMAIFSSARQFRISPIAPAFPSSVQSQASDLEFIIGTLEASEFELTVRKQATKQVSNGYQNGLFGFCPPRNSARISMNDAIGVTAPVTGLAHA